MLCEEPPVIEIDSAGPGRFVNWKKAGAVPATDATTLKEPAVPFAVAVTVTLPDGPVVGGPVRMADGPFPGALNVTGTPLTGFPAESFTVAVNGCGNWVPTCVLCTRPPPVRTSEGGPAVLARLNDTGDASRSRVGKILATTETVYAPAIVLAVGEPNRAGI